MQEQSFFIEYVVVFLYMIFMLIAGFCFRRFIKNHSDYFRSGCQGSWWLVGSSVFMFSFSAWTFTGAAGVAYNAGLSIAVIFLANALGYLSNTLVTAKYFRNMRAHTYPEVVQDRFNRVTQQFYVWIGIIPGIFTSALTLLGVSIFASAVFGFQLEYVIIFLGIAVLLYATIGGSWSVMATDFLQAMILMPLAVLITILSLQHIGGLETLVSTLQEKPDLSNMLRFVDPDPQSSFSQTWAAAMIFFVFLSYNSVTASVKFFTTKDGKGATKAAALSMTLMLVGAFIWFIPPIVARLSFPELVEAVDIPNPAEASYAIVALQLLPRGLSGLLVVAMFAATMSSVDTQLNQFAGIVTLNIYRPFFRPSASKRELFLIGQFASILVGVCIITAAVYFTRQEDFGLFEYMLTFGSLFATPMLVPMVASIFIRKAPWWSAIFSTLAGALVSFIGYRSGWVYERNVFSIASAGFAAFIITIPFWRFESEAYKKKVTEFFNKMNKPVDFEEEVGVGNDSVQLKILGYVALSIGIFLFLLTFLPNPLAGRLQIFILSLVIAIFGFVLTRLSNRYTDIEADQLERWKRVQQSLNTMEGNTDE